MGLWKTLTEAAGSFTIRKNVAAQTFEKEKNAAEDNQSKSLVDHYFSELDKRNDIPYGNAFSGIEKDKISPISTILTNKTQKLANFRALAESPIITDIIEEISMQALNFDENGECIKCTIINRDVDNTKHNKNNHDNIKAEFRKFVSNFDLENKLSDYVSELIIEGELCFENILNPEDITDGIIAVKKISNESYEFAFNVNTAKKEGITVMNNSSEVSQDVIKQTARKFGYNKSLQQLSTYNSDGSQDISNRAIFLPFEQLTYCTTGKFTQDGLNVIPTLNRVRKPFNQLTLIEDSILIYRIVRAPERLAFNIDGGTMSNAKAEELKLRLMKKYGNKAVYDKQSGTISNQYDAMSIMDNYWFVATNGGRGTKVESIGGTGNSLNNMEDLDYFKEKVYRSMNVPYTRKMEPTTDINRADTISYEEYRLAKFIMNTFLNKLANSIRTSFIRHLKFKGMLDNNDGTFYEHDIKINFVAPTSFDLYQTQKLLQAKIDMYTASKDVYNEEFNTYLAKHQLGMSDAECAAVQESYRQDQYFKAHTEYGVSNIGDGKDPDYVESDDDDDDY